MNIKGFTLIEQMLVVAVIAILASLAYPSFKEHFRKVRRADAQSALYALATSLEQFRMEQSSPTYVGSTPANHGTGPGAPCAELFPARNQAGGYDEYYRLEIFSAGISDYELRAIPIVSSDQANDKCGTFSLSSTGERKNLSLKAHDMVKSLECWK